MTGGRWHSWGAASPLWATGLVLILVGIGLVVAGFRSVKR